MKKIFKYELETIGNIQILELPEDFKYLWASEQLGKLVVWGEVTPEARKMIFNFLIVPTGGDVPDNRFTYMDTILFGPFVFHIYLAI